MSQTKPAIPEPNEIAGRYQVVQKLGAGAFGTVYKAKDKILGRMVAIKTIRLEGLAAAGASLDELMRRFKNEAQVSAQLKHPNIVTIYDIGDFNGLSYLAMEFIDGVGLEKIIASGGRLALERTASIGAQVADALDFAHRHNVVHRDIKPANIMIEGGDRVKVTDFGIAKVTDSGEHLTVSGSLLGTPSYMSPEQARGGELDGRSDLFAVGCVLYEMLAGQKAFRGDSITGLIFKIITEEPPPLRAMDPGISEEAVRIINKALAKAPEARYQSGRELAQDLLALTRAGATPTLRQSETPTSPGATMLLPGEGPPATVRSPATALGPGRTQVAAPPPPRAAAPPLPRPSPPPPRPMAKPAPAPSSKAGLFVGIAAAGLMVLLLLGVGGWFVLQRMSGTSSPNASTAPPTTLAAATTDTQPPATTPPATAPAAKVPPATAPPSSEQQVARAEDRPSRRLANERDSGTPTREGPAPTRREDAVPQVPIDPGRAIPQRREAPPASGDFGFLDELPADEGREAGEQLADAYRSKQGRSTTGPFGSSRRFRPRERTPRNLLPVEIPAVATLRHLITFEEAFHRKQGRYGTLAEMMQSGGLRLDSAISANGFQRRGYRFELSLTGDGFQITALPTAPGPRPFIGDDSGIVRPGLE